MHLVVVFFFLESGLAGFAERKVHGSKRSVDLNGSDHGVAGASSSHDVPQGPTEVFGSESNGHQQVPHTFPLHFRRLLQVCIADGDVCNLQVVLELIDPCNTKTVFSQDNILTLKRTH